jgi:hypothetical protein
MATEEEIRRQVEADVAKFVAARDAGQPTAGIGRPLDRSQFTGFTSKPRNCRRLNSVVHRL